MTKQSQVTFEHRESLSFDEGSQYRLFLTRLDSQNLPHTMGLGRSLIPGKYNGENFSFRVVATYEEAFRVGLAGMGTGLVKAVHIDEIP
jgi:hypothetical protein